MRLETLSPPGNFSLLQPKGPPGSVLAIKERGELIRSIFGRLRRTHARQLRCPRLEDVERRPVLLRTSSKGIRYGQVCLRGSEGRSVSRRR